MSYGSQSVGECVVDAYLLDCIGERAVVLAADFNPLDTCNLLVRHHFQAMSIVAHALAKLSRMSR